MQDQELIKKELIVSNNEKIKVSKSSYGRLQKLINKLNYKLSVLKNKNKELKWHLTSTREEMNYWKNCSDTWKKSYLEEHKKVKILWTLSVCLLIFTIFIIIFL